jgi:hypothetical protein
MNWTASWRTFASAIFSLLAGCATPPAQRTIFVINQGQFAESVTCGPVTWGGIQTRF